MQPRTQRHVQPQKQEEGACIIGGESGQQVSISPQEEN